MDDDDEVNTIANRFDYFGCDKRTIDDRFDVMVMSEAGKPIYTFSKREDAVTLMPLCSALMNYAQKTQGEILQSIRTSDNLLITFATRTPLIIIVIQDANSSLESKLLVDQVEAQIISILTAKTLRSLFEERATFDLKRLLYGSEKLIDSVINLSLAPFDLDMGSHNQSMMTASVTSYTASSSASTNFQVNPNTFKVLIPMVAMTQSSRDSVTNILHGMASSKNIVFSLLFKVTQREPISGNPKTKPPNDDGESSVSVSDQEDSKDLRFLLMSSCNHHKDHKLKKADIHLILALLYGFRSQLLSVESLWIPVCLPRFNQDAFLHSYIGFVNDTCQCLVLMSIDRDGFLDCQKARDSVIKKLESF